MRNRTGVRGSSRKSGMLPHRNRTGSDPFERLGDRVVITDGCWIVDGDAGKYVQLYAYGSYHMAHRYIYAESNGVVLTSDDVIHHRCENPGCINPSHLIATTHSDHARIHNGSIDETDADVTDSMGWQLAQDRMGR